MQFGLEDISQTGQTLAQKQHGPRFELLRTEMCQNTQMSCNIHPSVVRWRLQLEQECGRPNQNVMTVVLPAVEPSEAANKKIFKQVSFYLSHLSRVRKLPTETALAYGSEYKHCGPRENLICNQNQTPCGTNENVSSFNLDGRTHQSLFQLNVHSLDFWKKLFMDGLVWGQAITSQPWIHYLCLGWTYCRWVRKCAASRHQSVLAPDCRRTPCSQKRNSLVSRARKPFTSRNQYLCPFRRIFSLAALYVWQHCVAPCFVNQIAFVKAADFSIDFDQLSLQGWNRNSV